MTNDLGVGRPFGAILAGGRSRRYGSAKAIAEVGGHTMLARAWQALGQVADVVLIANDARADGWLPVRRRPDALPGAGPLGGVYTALSWARDERRAGAIVLACDMPFVTPALIGLILDRARMAPPGVDAVVPESPGPAGFEPLCAYYRVSVLDRLRNRIAAGQLGMARFVEEIDAVRVPIADVRRVGEPERLFLNVNSPADRDRAERLARAAAGPTRVHETRPDE